MKTIAAFALGVLAGGAAIHLAYPGPPAAGAPAVTTSTAAPAVIGAAQGRVEGRTENIEVEAGADGVIQSLLVSEGQRIARDQVIAEIGCGHLDSEIRALDASLESARQARVRLMRGAREEERRATAQDVASAQAIADQAQRQNERMQFLVSKDEVSRETAEKAARDLATASAALAAARERQKLANAGPLPEELAKADADIATITEKLHATEALRAKCTVRAPIAGTITRIHMRAGEAFSTVVPRPIVSIADLSERRIRAEVDERDLARIYLHQRVRISAESSAPFDGSVVWTSQVMGRKTARSTDPAERSDRDILETLIAPGRGAPALPLGLRVVVEFLP